MAELETLDGQTKAADKAVAALRKWTGDFRKQAKADLRKFPELCAVLGL